MRYLVTGGLGFIGGTIVRRLLAQGNQVTILDLPSKLQNSHPPRDAQVVTADIASEAAFRKLEGPFDAVFHLAAQTSARVSHEKPERDIDINARGTLLLAQWCLKNSVRRL